MNKSVDCVLFKWETPIINPRLEKWKALISWWQKSCNSNTDGGGSWYKMVVQKRLCIYMIRGSEQEGVAAHTLTNNTFTCLIVLSSMISWFTLLFLSSSLATSSFGWNTDPSLVRIHFIHHQGIICKFVDVSRPWVHKYWSGD